MKILAIGAHPDDIELGVGGTLAKHSNNGDEVYGLVLSNGEKTGHNRADEALKSANALGIRKLYFGNLPDTRISEGAETIEIIENVINKVRPDRIYSHTTRDPHQDHRSAGLSVISACRNYRVNQVLLFVSPLRQVDFQPKVFIDITPYMDLKLRSLKFFNSQYHKYYMRNKAVRGLATYWGYFIKRKYAECFEIERLVEY